MTNNARCFQYSLKLIDEKPMILFKTLIDPDIYDDNVDDVDDE